MKTWIVLSLVGFAFLLSAAELEWNVGKPWRKTEKGEYSISYDGKGWPALSKTLPVQPGRFYKLTWEDRLEGTEVPKWQAFVKRNGKMLITGLRLSPNWTARTVYVYSGDAGVLGLRLALDPDKTGRVFVRGAAWEALSPEELRENRIPNGNFESGSAGTEFWLNLNRKLELPVKIVVGQNFLNGEKSLEMDLPKREQGVCGIQSRSIPMEPGRTYTFTFWAKADSPMGITAAVSIWAPSGHRGKHSNQTRIFKIDTEWNEYRWDVTIPSDTAEYPDLADRMGSVVFMTWNADQTGTMWFDDISFQEK